MITDKRQDGKRIFISLLCVIFAVLLFSSCLGANEDKYNYGEMFDGIESALATTTGKINKEYYDVIIPSEISSDVYAAAKALCEKLERSNSYEAFLYYDYEAQDEYDAAHNYIYIGYHDNEVCRHAYEDFRSGDYRYSFINGVYVVGGVSEGATLEAIERFTIDVVDKPDGLELLKESEGFIYRADIYDDGKIYLNGYELSEYRIVYLDGDAEAMLIANTLCEDVERYFGYSLIVSSDGDCDANARSICVGRTDRADSFGLLCSDTESILLPYSTGVSIISENLFGLKLGASRFYSMLCEALDGRLEIDGGTSFEYRTQKSALLSFYFRKSTLGVDEIGSMCDTIRSSNELVIRLENISDTSVSYIKRNLENEFFAFSFTENNGRSVHYLCRKGRGIGKQKTIEVGDSSLWTLSIYEERSKLNFTIAELDAGDDAGLLGESPDYDELSGLLVFGDNKSAENDFLHSAKNIKRVYDDDLNICLALDRLSVNLVDVDYTENNVYERSILDFSFFYE